MLPSSFSWRSRHDAARLAMPRRVFATDAINQHEMSWCGCCYAVAVVQTVEDRSHIRLRRKYHVSMKHIMDHLQAWAQEHDGWNVCHGSSPARVLECLTEGQCPLVTDRRRWNFPGFPRTRSRCDRSDFPMRITGFRRVPETQVKHELINVGPLVLNISHVTCREVDSDGVSTDLVLRPVTHCVSVVGWTVRNDIECWVVRNSWGTERVPARLPEDYKTCVGVDRNECRTTYRPWTGMPSDPGFFLLPTSHPGLHIPTTPWIAVDVERREAPF